MGRHAGQVSAHDHEDFSPHVRFASHRCIKSSRDNKSSRSWAATCPTWRGVRHMGVGWPADAPGRRTNRHRRGRGAPRCASSEPLTRPTMINWLRIRADGKCGAGPTLVLAAVRAGNWPAAWHTLSFGITQRSAVADPQPPAQVSRRIVVAPARSGQRPSRCRRRLLCLDRPGRCPRGFVGFFVCWIVVALVCSVSIGPVGARARVCLVFVRLIVVAVVCSASTRPVGVRARRCRVFRPTSDMCFRLPALGGRDRRLRLPGHHDRARFGAYVAPPSKRSRVGWSPSGRRVV
jgi:hypothetical protein